jgi:hypothetical protein
MPDKSGSPDGTDEEEEDDAEADEPELDETDEEADKEVSSISIDWDPAPARRPRRIAISQPSFPFSQA